MLLAFARSRRRRRPRCAQHAVDDDVYAEGHSAEVYPKGYSAEKLEEEFQAAFEKIFDAPPVSIAVAGKRGVGKSTLINSLRGLRPTAPGAAKTGADETSFDADAFYSHCGMLFQDLPGCEGSSETAAMGKEYIKKYSLNTKDACIFVYTDVLEPRMVACAQLLQNEHGVPTFLVRNKVGQACKEEVEDGNMETEEQAFLKMKSTSFDQVAAASSECDSEVFKDPSRLFLVEAKYKDAVLARPPRQPYQKEFQRLKVAIQTGIKDEARAAQYKAICDEDAAGLAKARAEACRKCITGHALAGGAVGIIPFLIYPQRRRVVKAFMKQFGLTEEYFKELNDSGLMVAALGRQSAPKEVLDQIMLNVLTPWVDLKHALIMRRFCMRVIDALEPKAARFYKLEMSGKMPPPTATAGQRVF